MPLMGSLYIGASGLQTSQNALNSTGHNLSNINTEGYTRQQVLQSTRRYNTISMNMNSVSNQEVGLGTNFAKIRQVRDYFLDQTYRKESGRSMFYEISTNTMEEVESLLGEMNGEAFQTSLTNLWSSIQELTKDPSSSVTQGLLVHRAAEFIERANSVYEGLASYQDNLNQQAYNKVKEINEYGKKITELNEEITKIQSGGIESPNDLRDERNRLIDELSSLASLSYKEDMSGSISIRIEGVDFVSGEKYYPIDTKLDATTGFYTPFWPQNATYKILADGSKEYNIEGAQVFNLERTVSSDLDTDIGGLKAILLARGDHRANYTDIQDVNYDASVSQSIIMNIQAEFDQLVHSITTKINGILADASDAATGYLCDVTGKPIQLFEKKNTEGYLQTTGAGGSVVWEYMAEDPSKTETLYSIQNIEVSRNLLKEPSKLSFMLPDGQVDYETAEKMKAAFEEEAYTLNPNVQKKSSFINYYTDLISQVGNSGSVYRSIYENQKATVEATDGAREQIMGVSSDEELSSMIKFQNAYNASSRYINVISEMLEHILNTLGT